jgi:hypothetical protein
MSSDTYSSQNTDSNTAFSNRMSAIEFSVAREPTLISRNLGSNTSKFSGVSLLRLLLTAASSPLPRLGVQRLGVGTKAGADDDEVDDDEDDEKE